MDEKEKERRKSRRKRENSVLIILLALCVCFAGSTAVFAAKNSALKKQLESAGEAEAVDGNTSEDAAGAGLSEDEKEAYEDRIAELETALSEAEALKSDNEEDASKKEEKSDTEDVIRPDNSEDKEKSEDKENSEEKTVSEPVYENPGFLPYEDPMLKAYCTKNDTYDARVYTFESVYSYPTDLCFAGDSIIERCEWNVLYPSYTVKNRGVGGDSVEGLEARLKFIENTKPEKLFILIGINDIIGGTTREQLKGRYDALMDRLKEVFEDSETKIHFISVLPVTAELQSSGLAGNGRIDETNEDLKALCGEYGYTFINANAALKSEEGFLYDEYSRDGIHLSGNGVEALKLVIDKYIDNTEE